MGATPLVLVMAQSSKRCVFVGRPQCFDVRARSTLAQLLSCRGVFGIVVEMQLARKLRLKVCGQVAIATATVVGIMPHKRYPMAVQTCTCSYGYD